jgi:hypothetical protein
MRLAETFRLAAGVLWLGVCGGAFAPAAADRLVGDDKSLLVKGNDDTRMRFGGAEVVVDLPAGTEIEAVTSLREQAFVGGTARSPGKGSETELFLGLADRSGLRALPAPPSRAEGASREQAGALVGSRGELAGVAWLEGPTRESFAVKVADWNGTSWSEPVEISAAGPGSQQALTATTLDDGRAMLAWARYDGADDEIVYAVRERGSWSAPRPIGGENRIPDIVPAIVAVPGGALAAWSRYDGHDYRVVTSFWNGRDWSAPAAIGGAGSVFPSAHRTAGGARVLFESARPHGWTVVDLDAGGRKVRSAAVESPSPERPVLVGDELRWAGETRRLRFD